MSIKPNRLKCSTCSNRKSSVFCDLSSEHLNELEQTKTTNHYKAHQVIFYEGNQPYGLYCINSGKVKIYKMDDSGHQQIVRLAGKGDILGYRCILAGEPYTATAETIEESSVCFFDRATFLHVLETHPTTAQNVMKGLAKDLGNAERQIVNVVHKNVRERLAELFLIFKNRYGEQCDSGIRLNISLKRDELAELIGTTQESVIRLMSDFKSEGLIHVKGREITLLDVPNLTREANLPE